MRRSRKTTPLGMPAPQTLHLSRFAGVEQSIDPALVNPPWLTDAENVVLDTGAVAVRPGLTNVAKVGVTPFTGAGIWRMVDSTDKDTHVEEQEQRVLFVTQDGLDAAGNAICIIQALDLQNPTAGFVPVTPLDPVSGDGLLRAGRPVYFAQLNTILYAVNGRDGLFFANRGAEGAITLASNIPPMNTPAATASWGSLSPPGGFNWFSSDGTKLRVTRYATDVLHAKSHPPNIDTAVISQGNTYIESVTGAKGKWVYSVYSTALDLTSEPFDTDNLLVGAYVAVDSNFTAFTSFKLVLGTTIGGDATTDPTHVAFAPTLSNSVQLTLTHTANRTWEFLRPALNPKTQAAVLRQINYIALIAIDQRGILQAAQVLGTSTLPAIDSYGLILSDLVAPGRLPGATTYYVQRGYNSETGFFGPVSDPTRVDLYDFPVQTFTDTTLPVADEARRTKVVVDFTHLSSLIDTVLVYRSVPDPANQDPLLLPYHLVKTVHKADATVDGDGNAQTYTFYDNVAAGDALLTDSPDVADVTVQDGDNSPWFILSTGKRMVYLRSLAEPESAWASNIGKPAEVPTDDFETIARVGAGGRIAIGHDDGDEIMGGVQRSNEVLVFKKRSVYAWTFLAEGTPAETWKAERITTPGTLSTRSICPVPGGVVWYATDGLYYLPDDSDVASPFPVSLAVQRTFDALPAGSRDRVACAYWPLEGWLVVAVPGAGETENSEILVCNLRQRDAGHPLGRWFGRFTCDTVDGVGSRLLPRFLLAEGDDLFLSRGENGAIDRFLKPYEANAYEDYGGPIAFRIATGWMEPLDGRKLRLVRRQLQFTFDAESPLASEAQIAALLTLETRPNGDQQTYIHQATFAADGGPAGLLVSGASGDDMVHPTLVGQQVKVILQGSTTSPVPVRLLALRLGYIELGLWKG